MNMIRRMQQGGWWWLIAAVLLTCAVYYPGLSGGFIFDDYPNIADNPGVQPHDAVVGSLVKAALSSPSSEFKRPLASLSFALNYLATGLDPYWMKLTNLGIHLANGWLAFLLARRLLRLVPATTASAGMLAAWIAGAWLLLPVNLTAVLYVVQRMESMANFFVLLGLIGYVSGRQRMLSGSSATGRYGDYQALLLCLASLLVPTALGLLAKETAVMLPLYAATAEWVLFGFRGITGERDRRIIGLFMATLVVPMLAGMAWLLPGLMQPGTWAIRDFTLQTRLLSEARIVASYVVWVLAPQPMSLSFYHDDFVISTGLFHPWTTFAATLALAGLIALGLCLRRRQPLASLGILLFLGCQLLTGTVIPLELVYEHRNYFGSFGLLLAIIPLLAAITTRDVVPKPQVAIPAAPFFQLPRRTLLACMALWWASLTALTADAWGNPLHLAEELAARAPASPRAQYELGRTYIIYSHYDPASPFTRLAYAPLEKAAALPNSSILPEQALIFMNARMHLPAKDAWWDSLIAKLNAHKPGVQDESSLGALVQCARDHRCDLPQNRMMDANMAALSHPNPSARLLATYGDYAWNVIDDHALGLRMTQEAVKAAPDEPAYRITLIRMLQALGNSSAALAELKQLESLNYGGRLNASLAQLRSLPGLQ